MKILFIDVQFVANVIVRSKIPQLLKLLEDQQPMITFSEEPH